MSIHPTAARGFGQSADAYEQGRPDYPPAAVHCLVTALGISAGASVLDLGAGTGKLTRLLVPTGARLIAVEPVATMRQKLSDLLPQVAACEGTAEAIPLPDASVDAVVAAQAFHWFANRQALWEIQRVLRPGKGLGLIWNFRDETVDWVAQLGAILAGPEETVPSYKTSEWKNAFGETSYFGPLHLAQFAHVQEGDLGTMMARVASVSYIATLPPQERDRVMRAVRELLTTHPQTRDRERIAFPYRTDVYWTLKR